MREAHAAGQQAFGENYVQEALAKIAALADLRPAIEWHLIGPLQDVYKRQDHGVGVAPDRARIPDRLVGGEELVAGGNAVAADVNDARPVEGLAADGGAACRGQRLAAGQQVGAGADGAGLHGRVDVGAQRLRQLDRAFQVQLARTLLQQVVARQRLRAVLKDGLDQRWCEAGVGLQQHGCCTGHDGRGDGGAAQEHQALAVGGGRGHGGFQRREQRGQRVPGRRCGVGLRGAGAQHLVARCHQVGLERVVGPDDLGHRVDPDTARRATRAEQVDLVVAARGGRQCVDRTHGDDRRLVARRGDGTVDLFAFQAQPEVATRRNHGDAHRGGHAHGVAQRVVAVGVGGLGGQADVEHADVVFAGVVHDPVDAFDGVAHRADAGGVQHAHVVDVGVGCHAGGVGRLVEAAPCGHRGHVRAVAVGVLRGDAVGSDGRFVAGQRGAARLQRGLAHPRVGPVDQRRVEHVHAALDARSAVGIPEVPVRLHDAGIQDGNAHARAVEAGVGRRVAVGAHRAGGGLSLIHI